MCRAVPCQTCGKTTWAGCGQHVEQVMQGVPADDRCFGHFDDEPPSGGFFSRLFSGRQP